MDFDEYQERAVETAVDRAKELGTFYAALGIAGEAGEIAEKIKKIYKKMPA